MRAPLAPLLVLLACGPGAPAIESSTGGSDDTGATSGPGDEAPLYCIEQRKLDILFVVEDAPAMAAAQTGVRAPAARASTTSPARSPTPAPRRAASTRSPRCRRRSPAPTPRCHARGSSASPARATSATSTRARPPSASRCRGRPAASIRPR
jgi:hypothetical protein